MQGEGRLHPAQAARLSERLRHETADVHDAAERSAFLADLLAADRPVPRESYLRLLAQYLPIYTALEAAAALHRADPVVAALAHPGLDRAAAVAADLAVLGGPDWADRAEVTAATAAYVARIDAAASTPGGFVAHHYVRYLGDLSGGQIIRRILRRKLRQDDDRGLSFYVFPGIENGVQFKQEYRARLDAAPWDDAEIARIVAEARVAFELNLDVFESLGPADALAP